MVSEKRKRFWSWKCPRCDSWNEPQEEGYSLWRCRDCGRVRPCAIYTVTGFVLVLAVVAIAFTLKSYNPFSLYREKLVAVVDDLVIDDGEKKTIQFLMRRYRLKEPEWQAIHKDVFQELLQRVCTTNVQRMGNGEEIRSRMEKLAADLSAGDASFMEHLVGMIHQGCIGQDVTPPPSPEPSYPPTSCPPLPDIAMLHGLIEQGEFEKAMEGLEKILENFPGCFAAQTLYDELTTPIPMTIAFLYHLKGNSGYTLLTLDDPELVLDTPLTHEDSYRFRVTIDRPCYLYIYQEDSKGDLMVLFPNPVYDPVTNPLSPGTYEIPSGNRDFYLSKGTLTENIFIIVAPFRAQDLEYHYTSVKGATTPPDLFKNLNQFNIAIEKRRRVNLKSIHFWEIRFQHVLKRNET